MHKTCVISVNYHGASDTAKCVKSLLESRASVEIVIVDNSPDDPELVRSLDFAPGVTILRAPRNLGFGSANNLGINWAMQHNTCEFIFLLNNDTVIYEDSIAILESAMADQISVGIMVPRIAYLDRPEVLWYGGGEVDWRRASAFTPGINRSADADLALTERDVTFATGCALFIRRSALVQLGGFDPRFFMYEEDLEFCLRAAARGIGIRYIPRSLILHRVQGSNRSHTGDRSDFWSVTDPKLPFYAYHVIRNRLLNTYLHARGWQRGTALVFFPLFLMRRAIPFILGRRFDAVWAMCRGVGDSWKARRLREDVGAPVQLAK